jgi:hypothetical protein
MTYIALAELPMNAMRHPIVLCVWLVGLTAFAQAQEPMPLARRVREAKLIVVGKLQGTVTVSKHQDSSIVQVDKVLFGSAPTNKVLLVWYAGGRQLTPGIASSTHQISQTNRYICFLTFAHSRQPATDTFQARAIGKGHYAHNAFELATEGAMKEVATLIEKKGKKK